MVMNIPGIVQKKGIPNIPDGRMTVYAIIKHDADNSIPVVYPEAPYVCNGFLTAQSDYRKFSTITEFLRSEFGESIENGLEKVLYQPGKIPFNIKNLKDFFSDFNTTKDLLPVPAKIIRFYSEEDILIQEGDIFFAGIFQNVSNANSCINAFPIIYQAKYREIQLRLIKKEVDSLMADISELESFQINPETASIIESLMKM